MEDVREPILNLEAQHPLLIDKVANRVLQFVPKVHLKECRLVCKLWWMESLLRWRGTQWLNVTLNDPDAGRFERMRVRRFNDEEKLLKNCVWIGTYLNMLHLCHDHEYFQLRKYPFQKIHFFKSRLQFNDKHWKNELLGEFSKRCGPFVTSLWIEKCTIFSQDDFNRIVFRFSPKLEYLSLSDNLYKARRSPRNELINLDINKLLQKPRDLQPKLTHLKVSLVEVNPIAVDFLPLTWTQFLAHFPNIQKLELVKLNSLILMPDDDGFALDIQHILKSIRALRRDCGIMQQLTELDLLNLDDIGIDHFNHYVIDDLHKLSLPLTFFAYDGGFEHHHEYSRFDDLVGIGRETLETLIIYKAPLSNPFGGFPYGNQFPNLSKLTLIGAIVNDLLFLEHMPKLKSLRIFHRAQREFEYPIYPAMAEPKVLEQLEQFKARRITDFPLSQNYAIVDRIQVVGNTDFSVMAHLKFPNLEEFIIGSEFCEVGQVEQLTRLLPNVKRLRIGLDNGGFRAVCKFWSGLEGLDIQPISIDDEGYTGIVDGADTNATRLPNMSDLKSLRYFGMGEILQEATDVVTSELTDFSLQNGLNQLKYLERVSLMCSEDKMSDDNFDELKTRFPLPYSFVYRLMESSESEGASDSDSDEDENDNASDFNSEDDESEAASDDETDDNLSPQTSSSVFSCFMGFVSPLKTVFRKSK